MTFRKAHVPSFTLGAIIYASLLAAIIILFYEKLENPLWVAYVLLAVHLTLALVVTTIVVKRKQIQKSLFGFEVSDLSNSFTDINQAINDQKYTNLVSPIKQLISHWIIGKARLNLLVFTVLLMTAMGGFITLGVLYKQLNEMQEQNKLYNDLTSKSLNELQKQNQYLEEQLSQQRKEAYNNRKTVLLNYLYDEFDGTAKYNVKVRENALLEYLELEKPRKVHNLLRALNPKRVLYSDPNSPYQINLSHAKLSDIEFTGHSLDNTNLSYVDFKKSNLMFTDFQSSELSFSDFENSILVEANLSKTTLVFTNFYNAKMENVQLDMNNLYPVFMCNIYGASMPRKVKKYLLENNCVEEENLTSWKLNREKSFNILRN